MKLSVCLNVGGKRFMTTKETLLTYPDTLLGKKMAENKGDNDKVLELSFDRNPKLINYILDFYRTGELHLPKNVCSVVVERELKFWGIPGQLIRQCCWKRFEDDKNDAEIIEEIDEFLEDPFEMKGQTEVSLSTKLWWTMEHSNYSPAAKVWNLIYFCAVFLSVLNFLLQTTLTFREFLPEFLSHVSAANITVDSLGLTVEQRYMVTTPVLWLRRMETIIYCFFLGDLVLRFLVCPRKVQFFRQFKNGLDAFLLVHFAVLQVVEALWDGFDRENITQMEKGTLIAFYSFAILRALRVMHFAKDFDTMKVVWLSAKSSVKELLLLLICALSFVTLFGGLIYLIEVLNHVNTFPSIPAGMWWAIVTMTTVGYGDVYPVTVGGQLLGALCALSGVIVLALPVAVLASRFTDYHGNVSAQKQMKTTVKFLKDNLQFQKRGCCHDYGLEHELEGPKGQEKDRSETQTVPDVGERASREKDKTRWCYETARSKIHPMY